MEVSKQFQRLCQKQGLKFKLNTKVTAAKREGETVKVTIEGVKDGKTEEVKYFVFSLVVLLQKFFNNYLQNNEIILSYFSWKLMYY